MSKVIRLRQLLIGSPFKPMIPERMVWTSSSLKLFRRCPRKFFWKYIMRLRQHWTDKGLLIGSGFHHCLGAWYRGRRAKMRFIAKAMCDELEATAQLSESYLNQKDFDDLTKSIMMFRGMMMGYASIYRSDRTDWNINSHFIEKKFIVDCGEFDYAGMIDLVKDSDELVEHKTSSRIRSQYIDRLPLDTQIRGYVFGARKAFNLPIKTVLYDVVEKCKLRKKTNENIDEFSERIAMAYKSEPNRYFYREPLPIKQPMLDSFEYELHQTNDRYQRIITPLRGVDFAKDKGAWNDLFQSFGADDPRAWEPNDGACDDYFKLCPYHELCTKGLDKGNARMFEQGKHLHMELADGDDD